MIMAAGSSSSSSSNNNNNNNNSTSNDSPATKTATASSSSTAVRYRWAAGTAGSDEPSEPASSSSASSSSSSSSSFPASSHHEGMSKATSKGMSTKAKTAANPPPSAQQQHPQPPHWRDLLKREPWVLVPNGSINNYFDYVPLSWRVGPWTTTAKLYLLAVLGAVFVTPYYLTRYTDNNFNKSYLQSLNSARYDEAAPMMRLDPRVAFCYNALAALWMVGSAVHLYRTSPLGLKVWATYTVQSWTMLAFRHVLSAVAFLFPNSSLVVILAELARFPAACSATVTFVAWNFLVMPFIYTVMSTPEKRQAFAKFCFSPRLVNLHLINMGLAIVNGAYASPPRPLVAWDLYAAFIAVVLYMAFYLLVLDRIGVHLYAVFSPRAPSIVVIVTWTFLWGLYGATYAGWRHVMMS